MAAFLQTILRQIEEFWGRLSNAQRIRLGALSALLLVIIVVSAILFSRVDYAPLYADMETQDAAEVYTLLQGMGVKVKSTPNSVGKTTLSVPSGQREELRMQLASQGYPKSGTSNDYAIYLSSTGLTSSNETQRTMLNFQTADNLARTVELIEGIEDAQVNLNIKPESAFVIDRNTNRSTASVVLTLAPDFTLTVDRVRTVAYIVSRGCPGMEPEDVAITDSRGHLYSMEEEVITDAEAMLASYDPNVKYDAERAFERELSQKITEMLIPFFGEGRVQVLAKAYMNYDQQSISEKNYSRVPDAQDNPIAVSYRILRESIDGAAADLAEGQAGISANGDGPPEYQATGEEDGSSGPYSRYETEVNTALNEIVTTIEKAPGYIERLTCSVVYHIDADDTVDYNDSVRNIVMNATGISNKKDVSVERLPLNVASAEDPAATAALAAANERNQIFRLAIIALALVIVAVLLAKMLRDITKPKPVPMPVPVIETGLVAESGPPMFDLLIGGEDEIEDEIPEFESGAARNLTRERIEQFIERDPESVAQLLRGWLSEE